MKNNIIVNRNYFEFQYVIGRGGFGKVWQVIMKKTNKKYALKEMSKVKIIDRRSEKSIKAEREFLAKLRHPFIVNMNCAFQDYENLYLVMDLLTGGDLRYHICKIRRFSEEESKFFIACLLLGLEYIHENNIIHRDIKPENLVFDDKGYLRLTDFGVAKIRKEDNSSETSGTPGYMAPEVLMAQNHSFPVDFFAIGIMGYEFMLGQRPYLGKNRKEIKHQVLKKQAKIDEDDIAYGWSLESADFINRCLKRKESKRLGFVGGVKELKNHIWYKNYDWEKLYNKTLIAPFIPPKGGNFDKKYCEAIEKLSQETIERYQAYRSKKNFEHLFEGYTYINYELNHITSGNEANTRVTTNTKYSKPMITNPTINIDNIKNNKLFSPIFQKNEQFYNTQKKNINENININNISEKENINIDNNNILLPNKSKEKLILKKEQLDEKLKNDKKDIKIKIKSDDENLGNNNKIASSSLVSPSSVMSKNNINNQIKKINELFNNIDKNNQIRSSSVNKENYRQKNQLNSKKEKKIEFNLNKLNNKNLLSHQRNKNYGEDFAKIYNMGSFDNLSGDGTQIKSNFKEKILDNNNVNINNKYFVNSQRLKVNSIDNNRKKNILKNINGINSKTSFYLPQLNVGKTINYDSSLNSPSNNIKIRNKLNVNQFKYKINNANKKDLNIKKNKLLIIPGNNYQPIFKRSESSGFMNFGNNLGIKKTHRINRINFNGNNFVGLSNSQVSNGFNYNNRKLFRNSSDIFDKK